MTVRRLALALVAATALGSAFIHAQIPGRNVNMVSGTKLPDGDPFLQRQNEPSVAASTRNPLHLLAGANDYRTIDLPGLPGAEETGDAWLGVFKSVDGGQRWTSALIPGYPQDPLRNLSPLKSYGAAADPVVRAGTNGFIYYAGLAFNRGTNGSSAVFVSRFIDDNNREKRDPFSYLGTSIVSSDTGATGRLLDKPWIAVDIPRDNRTCPVTTTIIKPPAAPGGQPTTVTETHNLPAGPVYVAYAAFTGSGSTLKSDIMFQSSVNCGVTWSTPVRLSAADGSINQGVTIAIEPNTGAVTVGWRRFTKAGSTQTDAIMVAQSLTLGRLFAGALAIRKLPRLKSLVRVLESILEHRRQQGGVAIEELTEFDAKTAPNSTDPSGIQTRTNTYPTMAWDDKGRLYVAWSERGFSTSADPQRRDVLVGDAKIVMASALLGLAWSAPKAVSETSVSGHQFMPSLAFAGGKLLLVYYDLREDISQLYGPFFDDKDAAVSSGKRHTLDIRASLGTPGTLTPAFAPSVRVSDYFIGHRPVPHPENFVPCPTDPLRNDCEQLQYNPPNLTMFKQGTVPFFGDYIDISPAPAFVPTARGGWAYNTSRSAVPIFHAVWTDNRDVRPPANGDWTKYTPPTINGQPSNGSTIVCDVNGQNFGSRNQNVYTARITGGLLVGSPGNSKPLSQALQRGFVVFAQNTTTVLKAFRMQVASQPIGGFASFQQIFPPQQPVTFIDVVVPPLSTAARTLYVTSSDEHARVTVNVFEIAQAGSGTPTPNGLTGTIILNADIENADIENADIENADIENADIENTELIDADIENPSFRSADIENADIENADIENADIENADIENADIENADIENADIENADIENTPFADAPKTDITWAVTNTGNTTSAFNVNLFLSQNAPAGGVKTQIILHKAYLTPAAASCDLKLRSHTVLVSNITNPNFVTPTGTIPDPNSPASNNPTLFLGPDEKGYITLRIHDIDPTDNVIIINDKGERISVDSHFVPGTTLAPIVVAQEIGTEDLNDGVTTPPIITIDNSSMFFVTQPTTSVAGVVMNPVRVQVRDRSGAVAPGVNVTLSLGASPDETAVLRGVLTKTTDATGVAVFDTLQISTPGDGYRLRATASLSGILPTDSVPFSVRPASTMSFVTQPTTAVAGVVMDPVRVEVRDNSGALVPGTNVTLSLGTNPTGALLGGVLTKTTDATGIATFDTLQINLPGDGYQLHAVGSQVGRTTGVSPTDSILFSVLPVTGVSSVDDPAGDARGNINGADIVNTTVLNTADALVFQLRFVPGTFHLASTYIELFLDTDRSPATGYPGIDGGCETDATFIGSEYLVNAQAGAVGIFQNTPTPESRCAFSELTDAPPPTIDTLTNGNGYDITVPLATINSNGVLNFKIAVWEQAASGGYQKVDEIPDIGLPAATTGVSGASITTSSVPGAIVGTLYGPRTLQQVGLTGPLTWTLQSGSLPAGVTLDSSTGTLSGVATTAGVSNFVVRVQSGGSNFATRAFTITAMTINGGDLIVADGAVFTTSGSLYRVTPGGAVSLIASISGMPHGVAQDGNSFVVVDRTNNSVLRVTPGNVETLYTASGPAGYIAVAVTHAGDILVGDNIADKVYKLSNNQSGTPTLTTLGNLPSSPSESQGVDIVVEPNGGVMVVNDEGGAGAPVQLVHFDDVTGVVPPTVVTTTVASAGAITLHSSGDFLLADFQDGQQIVRVTSGGATVGSPTPSGSGSNLVGLVVDFDESIYTASNFGTEIRHISTGGSSAVTSGSPFVFLNDVAQFRPVNTFERFVDGTPACTSCAVKNEFAALGTTFSFVTTNQTGLTNVQLSGPTLFDRPSDGSNHSITAPGTLTSWFTGTMTISTSGHPRTVTFRLHGNNGIPTFPISALDTQNNPIAIQRRNVFTYTVGNNVAREETVVITSATGIATITVDMPGFVLFIDDFVIRQ